MATVENPTESVLNGKNSGTHQAHGLATPEATPGPDNDRLEADKARILKETLASKEKPPDTGDQKASEGGPTPKTIPSSKVDKRDGVRKESDGEAQGALRECISIAFHCATPVWPLLQNLHFMLYFPSI